jgi:hypothetical protein
MKKLKLYIPAIALLSLVACKKSFLDTEDVTNATEQNFYKTQSDAFKPSKHWSVCTMDCNGRVPPGSAWQLFQLRLCRIMHLAPPGMQTGLDFR